MPPPCCTFIKYHISERSRRQVAFQFIVPSSCPAEKSEPLPSCRRILHPFSPYPLNKTRKTSIGPEVYAILLDWCYKEIYRELKRRLDQSMTVQNRDDRSVPSRPGAAPVEPPRPVGALATFPLRDPPMCRSCGAVCERRISNSGTPNDGRPFYECPMCPAASSFVTFDDFIGINKRFPVCYCQPALASRRLYSGLRAPAPGREFYVCPVGRCKFFSWVDKPVVPTYLLVPRARQDQRAEDASTGGGGCGPKRKRPKAEDE